MLVNYIKDFSTSIHIAAQYTHTYTHTIDIISKANNKSEHQLKNKIETWRLEKSEVSFKSEF